MISPISIFHKASDLLINKMVLSSLVLCNNFASHSALDPENLMKQNEKWTEPTGFDTNILMYNTIVKRKTKLLLQSKNTVKWYSCGPTVYDSAHIGHASSYVKLDIIRRILESVFNLNVFYLMGVTDIDDKIIKRSNDAKEDFRTLAHRYQVEFFSDMEKLNVLPPTMTTRVSDHIPDIVSFIDTIVTKGHGYKGSSGSVYFNAGCCDGYGKLRVPIVDDTGEKATADKRSPLDFTLWKSVKPGEPHWDSPWGPGRPGWHIECSAMASKVLGPQLDIHSGGQDLVFPHHENEEAQSCAHHNTSQWVNYWLHTGTLQVSGDVKMSKSLKNTISIPRLLEQYSSNHFRMLCLLSSYRNRVEFSHEAMLTASGNCRRIESFLADCANYLSGVRTMGVIDEPAVLQSVEETKVAIRERLADDFDTGRAMDHLLKLVSSVNTMLAKPSVNAMRGGKVAVATAANYVKHTLTTLGYSFHSDMGAGGDHKRLSSVLDAGVGLRSMGAGGDHKRLSSVLDAAVGLRSTVREVALNSDMAAATKPQRIRLLQACDQLRDDLSHAGVELKDHGQKTSWNLKDVVSDS